MSHQLIRATDDGCEAEVWRLIQAGADVNAQDRSGRRKTPLTVAAARGHFSIVCLLCNHGADPDVRNAQDRNAIYVALSHGYEDIGIYLFGRTKHPNGIVDGRDGSTALHTACRMRFIRAVRNFLKAGVDVNAVNSREQSPFQLVQQWEHSDTSDRRGPRRKTALIQLLLEYGARPFDVGITSSVEPAQSQVRDFAYPEPQAGHVQARVRDFPTQDPQVQSAVEEKMNLANFHRIEDPQAEIWHGEIEDSECLRSDLQLSTRPKVEQEVMSRPTPSHIRAMFDQADLTIQQLASCTDSFPGMTISRRRTSCSASSRRQLGSSSSLPYTSEDMSWDDYLVSIR